MIVFDSDDFGCNHVISDMCQSHDCRDMLMSFKEANPLFKATLFAIPNEMTPELFKWYKDNKEWIELAIHGFTHSSNYECEKLSYVDFGRWLTGYWPAWTYMKDYFIKGFKAPGWQISDGAYQWLMENGYWVADQAYNNERRPKELPAYVNDNGQFSANGISYTGAHYHTWDCVGNGVYEKHDEIIQIIGNETEFKFISEVINEAYSNEK